MNPKELIIKFTENLDKLGITNYSVNHSETDFGKSSYIYVASLKLRASDHDTGISRMLSEVAVCELSFAPVLDLIERLVYPDRFEKKVILTWGDDFEMKMEKITSIDYCEVEIIKEVSRISKKGHEMSLIRRRNIESVVFLRKNQ